MPNTLKPGAVIFAKDVHKVAQFYQELLGMEVKHHDPDKAVLETDRLSLVIHGIPKQIADSIAITSPPQHRENTALKLVLPVPSIAETRVKAEALGGGVKPVSAEWAVANFRACDGFDPEGNIVQFRESLS